MPEVLNLTLNPKPLTCLSQAWTAAAEKCRQRRRRPFVGFRRRVWGFQGSGAEPGLSDLGRRIIMLLYDSRIQVRVLQVQVGIQGIGFRLSVLAYN